jgi:hypothetical protein
VLGLIAWILAVSWGVVTRVLDLHRDRAIEMYCLAFSLGLGRPGGTSV